MIRRAHRSGGLFLVAALAGPLAAGCGEDEGSACDYAVCSIDEASCIERVAAAVGCHLGREVIHPEVRFISVEQYLAEAREQATPPTAEQRRTTAAYIRALALLGLMPEGYDPEDLGDDSVQNFAAFYSPTSKQIILLTDRSAGDPEQDYLVLVHEMIHAYQDAAWDLTALDEAHATTYDRFLGLRAWVEGHAVHHQNLASLALAGLDPEGIDWPGYFDERQDASLQRAAKSETPALDVLAHFPYAYGGEFALTAWQHGGESASAAVWQRPPDSTRQVILGYWVWPDAIANQDSSLDPWALAILPENYELLTGDHEGVWSINAMLQRTADGELWADELGVVTTDYLAAWRWNDDEVVAMWRLRTVDPDALRAALTRPGARWVSDLADVPTTHLVTRTDPALPGYESDVLLIAVSSGDARTVMADISGWQSVDAAAMTGESAAGHRAGRVDTRRLACDPRR